RGTGGEAPRKESRKIASPKLYYQRCAAYQRSLPMKKILLLAALVVLALAATPAAAQSRTTITLLHFSDYHSHAVPFYSEGQADSAGIGRLIAYLQPYANDPNSLIF